MHLRKWDDLPYNMKNEGVRKYYDILYRKRFTLLFKRIFDIVFSILIFIILSPIFIIIAAFIKLDSKGPIMFRQIRVTQYGKLFRIFKFRTMVNSAEVLGTQVTSKNDIRITRFGRYLRKFRLDEIPQLFNIILGDMSFVGTRPEVVKYVERYTDEMMAALLLPAGVTSIASIKYKDEDLLLTGAGDIDEIYVNKILPEKMKYNLKSIENFSLRCDFKTMISTVKAVIKKDNRRFIKTESANKSEAGR